MQVNAPHSHKPKVFACYCRKDRELVRHMGSFLVAAQVLVFRDEDSISYGAIWRDEISAAVQDCERMFVFWCAHAAQSDEVRQEYELARTLEKRVVPILIDSTPLPQELKILQALDMRGLLEEAHDAKLAELSEYSAELAARPTGPAITSTGLAGPSWLSEAVMQFTKQAMARIQASNGP